MTYQLYNPNCTSSITSSTLVYPPTHLLYCHT
jgi:hypothetical protein